MYFNPFCLFHLFNKAKHILYAHYRKKKSFTEILQKGSFIIVISLFNISIMYKGQIQELIKE